MGRAAFKAVGTLDGVRWVRLLPLPPLSDTTSKNTGCKARRSRGAAIHPCCLWPWRMRCPCCRAGWAAVSKGYGFADTTNGRIRNLIGRTFVDCAGYNLNLDLLNAKTKEIGYLVLWSRTLNLLRGSKSIVDTRIAFEMKARDGSNAFIKGDTSSTGRYAYSSQAVGVLTACSTVTKAWLQPMWMWPRYSPTRGYWRLQCFIAVSLAMLEKVVDCLFPGWPRLLQVPSGQ